MPHHPLRSIWSPWIAPLKPSPFSSPVSAERYQNKSCSLLHLCLRNPLQTFPFSFLGCFTITIIPLHFFLFLFLFLPLNWSLRNVQPSSFHSSLLIFFRVHLSHSWNPKVASYRGAWK